MPIKRHLNSPQNELRPEDWAACRDEPPPPNPHNRFSKFVLWGPDWSADSSPHLPKIAAIWEAARAAVLPEYIRQHPGLRPRFWWQFDALERKRHLVRGNSCDKLLSPLHWGLPYYRNYDGSQPAVESEAAYLRRHGLLTASESKRLTADDFRPQPLVDLYDSYGNLDVDRRLFSPRHAAYLRARE